MAHSQQPSGDQGISSSPEVRTDLFAEPPEVRTEPPYHINMTQFYQVKSLIRCEDDCKLLRFMDDNKDENLKFNLMDDPVLSVVIACKKTNLAIKLIKRMPNETLVNQGLDKKNFYGDTALHIAAAVNDVEVAKALVDKKQDLLLEMNKKQETVLHMAAINGHKNMFWYLAGVATARAEAHAIWRWRKEDGSNVLHCAIMGNAPVLALEIAKHYPDLILTRNDRAVTPLQLMVTIPEFFRSQLKLGTLDSFFFDWIPLDVEKHRESRGLDEESSAPQSTKTGTGIRDFDADYISDPWKNIRYKIPSQYSTLFDLLELIRKHLVAWIVLFVFNILKQFSTNLSYLEERKRKHMQALELVEHLAKIKEDGVEFDFYAKGYTAKGMLTLRSFDSYGLNDNGSTMSAFDGPVTDQVDKRSKPGEEQQQLHSKLIDNLSRFFGLLLKRQKEDITELVRSMKNLEGTTSMSDMRWHESPLITGTKLGLDDFVLKILEVCPQSAICLDDDGRTVLETAVRYGRKEILKTIDKMTHGDLPILPSWLYSHLDNNRNTILHFAWENIGREGLGDLIQVQDEIRWFETVKNIVPREMRNSRNVEEMTAQELFSEEHKPMLRSCQTQLVDMAKTCASLAAAMVFASSFTIPGEKNPNTGNPLYFDRLPFKIFSHAYVIGFACAATSLVLFLWLVITPYGDRDFRLAVPMKYFFACLSFTIALLGFLVSFTCNIFLQIYGGQRTGKDLIPLILELTVFPAICLIMLHYSGARFGPSLFRFWAPV